VWTWNQFKDTLALCHYYSQCVFIFPSPPHNNRRLYHRIALAARANSEMWSTACTTMLLLVLRISSLALAPVSSFSWSPLQQHSRLHKPFSSPSFITNKCSTSHRNRQHQPISTLSATADATPSTNNNTKRLETLSTIANDAIKAHGSEIFKQFNARVGVISPSSSTDTDFQQNYLRLGLIATESVSKDDQTIASLPFFDTDGSGLALAPHIATKVVYKDALPEGYDGWTGDVGLLAMLVLNEMARLNVDGGADNKGIDLPTRKEGIQSLMSAWVASLPSPVEMEGMHPLMWNEEEQEMMQSSSTKKIYRLLDDIDDDSSWLDEKVWSLDRSTFPESVKIQVGDEVEERPCFSQEGFRYAVSLVRSRSFFVDGSLRLLPYLDFANHDDFDSLELVGGGIGTLWGSAKGALLKSGKALEVGDEIRISYGPKGPADYLLDHGFVPPMCQTTSGTGGAITAELSFEIDDSDRFRDDKLDVLEYETYDLAPMEPLQVFDVTGGPGSTGEPDPAMIQFLRLINLGGKDAFLLESIFRKEIWGFMSEPVSEANERLAVMAVVEACEKALSEMEGPVGGDITSLSEKMRLCNMVRESERQALERTLIYVKQEAEALDLKEYYQERRLKSLGLDSEWSPENDDVGWAGNRVPGGADYDW
jgi:[ribulose-bisphosphate carboxylase]-lysine N-methyltransferase